MTLTKIKGNKRIIKIITIALVASNIMTIISLCSKNKELNSLIHENSNLEKNVKDNKKEIERLKEELSIKMNSHSDIRLIQPNILEMVDDIVKNHNMNIEQADILRAISSTENRIMDEYIRILSLILATMEIETNFSYKTNENKNGTKDHGIMQVNDSIIPHIKEALGKQLDPVNDKDHNVEAGSYEIYECYLKAKEKHPEDVIWWTYAYYNRGMFFENTDAWKNHNNPRYKEVHNQANVRSEKFKKVYLKYYNELITLI